MHRLAFLFLSKSLASYPEEDQRYKVLVESSSSVEGRLSLLSLDY